MQTLLITGGCGFIGSNLVRMLLADGRYHVVNLDLLTYAATDVSLQDVRRRPGYTLVQGDISDVELVASVFEKHAPAAVLNLAAESHVDRSIEDAEPFVNTNVNGVFVLLEAARQYYTKLDSESQNRFRFVQVSTDEVFGSIHAPGAFTEASPYQPSSPYAASKAAGDHFARAYQRTYGLPVMVTNASNNYGPYQFPEKLIPLMILNALQGKPLPLYGDGLQVRDWLHVHDHCRAIIAVLERGAVGGSYNIGGGCELTNRQVVQQICKAVDQLRAASEENSATRLITHVKDRPGHDARYAVDTTKIRTTLNWQPETGFEAGLAETVAWYMNHPEWVAAAESSGYQRQRLGLPE